MLRIVRIAFLAFIGLSAALISGSAFAGPGHVAIVVESFEVASATDDVDAVGQERTEIELDSFRPMHGQGCPSHNIESCCAAACHAAAEIYSASSSLIMARRTKLSIIEYQSLKYVLAMLFERPPRGFAGLTAEA
jgi:hypothetical protein